MQCITRNRPVAMTPRSWHGLARMHLRRCSGAALRSPRLAYQAAVLAKDLQEDAHQLAAIEHLERLHHELLVWRPPPPPPPPPPPKESTWRGPIMDAYGEPIGGGTYYTGAQGGETNAITQARAATGTRTACVERPCIRHSRRTARGVTPLETWDRQP